MYLLAVFRAITTVLMNRRYRPELHYMRGPGPKWFEPHGRYSAAERRVGGSHVVGRRRHGPGEIAG